MVKKVIVSTLAVLFLVASSSMCFADDGPGGNKRKGKYTYKKVYKTCFKAGKIDAKKPFISPSDKTMAQWKRIFDKKEYAIFKCADQWGALTKEEIKNIYSYLYGYAADSPSPAKCK